MSETLILIHLSFFLFYYFHIVFLSFFLSLFSTLKCAHSFELENADAIDAVSGLLLGPPGY